MEETDPGQAPPFLHIPSTYRVLTLSLAHHLNEKPSAHLPWTENNVSMPHFVQVNSVGLTGGPRHKRRCRDAFTVGIKHLPLAGAAANMYSTQYLTTGCLDKTYSLSCRGHLKTETEVVYARAGI